MANEDVAWVDVLPSMSKFMPSIDRALSAGMPAAGRKAGQQFGSSFASSASDGVEAASDKMSAARKKLADSTGSLRVAEAKLEELRKGGKATAAQIVAAEERVEKARRGVDTANGQVVRSTRLVADAQTNAARASRTAGDGMAHAATQGGVFRRSWTGLAGLALGVSAGIATMGGAFRFVGDAISKARDLNETINKSNVIFGTNAAVINAWAKGSARSVGLSKQAALDTAAQFGNMYTQLGFTARAAADMSIKTVQMSADLGSFNNMPTADVAERIAAGFRGEYDSLQQLIPNISAARVESEAMAISGKKNADALTAQDKATAVLAIVQKDGSKAMGDFARTSGGLANQQKILSAEWDNAKAKLGALLVGPMTRIVSWTSGTLLPVLGGAWKEITGSFTAFAAAWRYNDGDITSSGMPGLFERLGYFARQAWDVLNGQVIPVLKATAGFFLDNQWAIGVLVGAYTAWRVAAMASTAVLAAQSAAAFITTASTYGLSYALTYGGTAAKLYAAGQWLANTALLGFPLTWIIGGLLAVGAGLYLLWTRSETFRDIVGGVWSAVSGYLSFAWNTVWKPTLTFLRTAWDVVSAGIVTGWEDYIKPAWAAVVRTAQTMWEQLQPVFRFIGQVWAQILGAMKIAWDTVLQPVWRAVQTVATSLYENILKPVFAGISSAWRIAVMVIQDVWRNILQPVWKLVAAVATGLWKLTLGPIFDLIKIGWTILVTAMKVAWTLIGHPMFRLISAVVSGIWNGVLEPIFRLIGSAWRGLMTGMEAVYRTVLRPMFSLFAQAVNGLTTLFTNVVSGIQTTWDRLKAIAAKPINFIVRTVLRDGLFKAWNWVLDKLGVSSWHVDTGASWLQGIPGYAKGGTIGGHSPSPTADNVPIWATAGEFMQPVPTVNYYGSDVMEAIRQRRIPREALQMFASGGIISLGRKFQSMGARVSEHPAFGGVTPGAHVAGSQHYLANAIDVNTRAGTSAQEQRELTPMAKIARDLGFYVLWMTSGHFNHLHADGRNGGGGEGFATGPDPWWETAWGSVTGAYNYLKDATGRAKELGSSPLGSWLQTMPGKLVGTMWDKVRGMVETLFSTGTQEAAPGGAVTGAGGTKAGVQNVAKAFGWGTGANWSAIDWLIGKESSWNPTAQNPTSSASGLFQHIRSTWQANRRGSATQYGAMREAPVSEQAWAGLKYVRDRYGSPTATKAFWERNHWYSQGGPIMPVFHSGGTTAGWRSEGPAMLAPDERVFSRPQDDYFRRFVDATSNTTGGAGGDRMLAKQLTVVQQPGETVDAFTGRLLHKVKVIDRGGAFAFEED